MPSFDVVSRVNSQEVDNAVNQVRKEIATRYDFKGSRASVELDGETITMLADNKMMMESLIQILKEKMVKRGIGLRVLDFKEQESASMSAIRQVVLVKNGLNSDDCRAIVKLIKDSGLKKVNTQIQQDQVRVIAQKRDLLQEVIAILKANADYELQFVNFKD